MPVTIIVLSKILPKAPRKPRVASKVDTAEVNEQKPKSDSSVIIEAKKT